MTEQTSFHGVTLGHSWEAAHRLPELPGKCQNLHGHSWRAEVTIVTRELTPDVTVVEFGAFKTGLRNWIDTHLDHAAMLGADDMLTATLLTHDLKVFTFHDPYPWPTVEAVAAVIGEQADRILQGLHQHRATAQGVRVDTVTVHETANNSATWGCLQ